MKNPMDKDTAEVIFQPTGRRGKVPKGTTIIETSRLLSVGIEALCGGHHVCGKCKVLIESGPGNAGPWQTIGRIGHRQPETEDLQCMLLYHLAGPGRRADRVRHAGGDRR